MREMIFLTVAVAIVGVLVWLSYKSKQKRFPTMFAVALLSLCAFYLFQFGPLGSFSIKALSAEASFIREKRVEVEQDAREIAEIRNQLQELLQLSKKSQTEIDAAKARILAIEKSLHREPGEVRFP